MTLDDLEPGSDFVIDGLTSCGEIRKRMVDMGFIAGARGTILRRALLGDPVELRLGRSLVAVRRKEARGVRVVGGRAPSP